MVPTRWGGDVRTCSVSSSCTVSNSDPSCTVRSSSQSQYALFQIATPSLLNITEVNYINLQWTCDPRVSAYALIFVVPLVVLATALFACFGIYWIHNHFHRLKHRRSLQDNPVAYINSEAAMSDDDPPPPYSVLPI